MQESTDLFNWTNDEVIFEFLSFLNFQDQVPIVDLRYLLPISWAEKIQGLNSNLVTESN